MNKTKKLSQIHQKRIKAAKAKGSGKKKGTYVSKAKRAKLEESTEAEHSTANTDESPSSETQS
jgi:hypothetical protein